jgi:cytochrome c oxidase assembly factor CtaG
MPNVFTWIYALCFTILIGAELVAVASPAKNDTVTEHWRWTRDALKDLPAGGALSWIFVVAHIGFLGWLLLHWALPNGTI